MHIVERSKTELLEQVFGMRDVFCRHTSASVALTSSRIRPNHCESLENARSNCAQSASDPANPKRTQLGEYGKIRDQM